jgi:hypothetical protein
MTLRSVRPQYFSEEMAYFFNYRRHQMVVIDVIQCRDLSNKSLGSILAILSAYRHVESCETQPLCTLGSGRPSDVVVRSKARPFTGNRFFQVREGL